MEDRRRRPVDRLAEEPSVMWHLYAVGESAKYPMWALIDDASPTWFSSDRMDQLIADLELLQSPPEILARQLRWKRTLQDGIAKIQAQLEAQAAAPDTGAPRRHSRRLAPAAPSGPTLDWMRQCVLQAESQQPTFPESLREETVAPHIGSIIALAKRCRQIKGYLGHDPFASLS